jgi:prepilin-type N-terminal cleavage/methylation domain-containing protein
MSRFFLSKKDVWYDEPQAGGCFQSVALVRRGFTLLEVIVACVILAMLAGIATYSLRGRIQSTQLIQANGTIASIDRAARVVARKSGAGARLVFDAKENQIRIEAGRRIQKVVRLPRTVPITGVRIGRATTRRSADVSISALGQSLSYGVELGFGDDVRWIVVSGVSGQVFEVSNSEQANALLRM